ncbi:MAG: hypothetical protein V4660_03585 [Pseudomonadota bacterium]
MKLNKQSTAFAMITFLGYPMALIGSYFGYGIVIFLAVLWSSIVGALIIHKYLSGKDKIYGIALYFSICCLLNYMHVFFSHEQPKSTVGAVYGLLILQGGIFLMLIAMFHIGKKFKKNDIRNPQ